MKFLKCSLLLIPLHFFIPAPGIAEMMGVPEYSSVLNSDEAKAFIYLDASFTRVNWEERKPV